jgi:putative ABC transport system permease protein
MESLFGLPMQTLMVILVAMFAIAIGSVTCILVTNRTMFKMGLRNVPRRKLQTGLIVVGLMLATLIITASFTTGDTIDYSLSSKAFDQWGRTDLVLSIRGEDSEDAKGADVFVPGTVAGNLQQQFADDADQPLFMPFMYTRAAVTSDSTKLSEPTANLVGIDPAIVSQIGGIELANGGAFDVTTLGANDVIVSGRAAKAMDAQVGDTLTVLTGGKPHSATVVAIAKDSQLTGVLGNFDQVIRPGGVVMTLATVQEWTGHPGAVNYISVALSGDVRSTVEDGPAAAERIEKFLATAKGKNIVSLSGRPVEVEAVKAEDVDQAEEFGNLFTTFFLVIGGFSIAAGIMLIFLIFVMLAAERKPEIGMARAVGAQRSSLVQSFVSEGMSYNLFAGVIGAGLGVAASAALVVGFLKANMGDDFDFISAHFTARSIMISFCLGVVLTFVTVVFASMKVSGVNIVAAVRGTPEDETPAKRRKISWFWVAVGLPALIIPPLGIWLFFNKGWGIPSAWIMAPLGIALGALSILAANGGGSEFLFSFGFSVIPLSLAILATHYRAPGRVTWTAVGAFLAAYWLSPVNIGEELLGRDLTGDIEMFLLSGIMVVISFTLIIVYNARLLTLLFHRNGGFRYGVPLAAIAAAMGFAVAGVALGDWGNSVGQLCYLFAGLLVIVAGFSFAAARFPALQPVLKMGVAYPLSNRFRTGMTVAMFALIIFSLVTFSAIQANFIALFGGEKGNGGYDIVATANLDSDVSDVKGALADAGSRIVGQITDTAPVTTLAGQPEVRVGNEWSAYPVIAASDAYLAEGTVLDARGLGYATDAEVLAAVRNDPSLALIDINAVDPQSGNVWTVDADIENDVLTPFQVTIRDRGHAPMKTVTVIGVLANRVDMTIADGIFVNSDAYTPLFGEPQFNRTYVRLAAGTDSEAAATDIEAALASRGVQAYSIRKLIDDQNAQQQAFNRMFQGLMALGLLVGVAALGVIAFRSVVERRQQIGMLRAIGYQREAIALTFMMESVFIGLMGILSGVVGGVIVSRNVFTTGIFSNEGVDFTMPWMEVLVMTAVAFGISLVMTWLPSRNAAAVPVADALRYE